MVVVQSQTTIRGYEIQEKIGEGGFGAVYRAYQPTVRRTVAIKVILPQYANHPDFIRRFEAEAQLVARLEHPFIIPLHDYWREADGAYLVMRYFRGGTLKDKLKRDGALSDIQAIRLVEQVAAALAVAHRYGVIHRDLKPANILLDDEGNAFLTDFGIAKDIGHPGQLTQEKILIGSPAYLAPEQITSDTIAPQADIYSLGVVIFEILTGVHPYGDVSSGQLLAMHLRDPLPPLASLRPDLPEAVNQVIQKATAKQPVERYGDTYALATAFQQAMAAALTSVDKEATIIADSPPLIPINPYKGLRAFQEADAADFFGREALAQRLLDRLAEDHPLAHFLAVVGPSGSGKSSLVRAGLVPSLRAGKLSGAEDWYIASMFPSENPLEELETALGRVAATPVNVLPILQQNERGLLRAFKQILPNETHPLLLIVDQFEEVFTLVADEATRVHFMNLLHTAATDKQGLVYVVVTLRADFYDRPLLYPTFGDLLRQRMETILPPTPKDLERAIVAPAHRVGLQVDSSLVATMVADVKQQPGALPMFQYALTELFDHRDNHTLTLKSYQQLGGVTGVLAQRADEVYGRLTPSEQATARQLFLRLMTLGEGTEDTRRRTHQSELVLAGGETMLTVIEAFDRSRLLTFDRDPISREPTVEVAHEALIREWGRLRQWLDTSRHDVRQQRSLAVAALEWSQANNDRSYLLTGSRLAQFGEWVSQTTVDLTPDEWAFLDASIAENLRQQTQRRRFRNAALVTTGVITLILAVLALIAFDRAAKARDSEVRAVEERDKAQRQADVNHSLVLAYEAVQRYDSLNPDLALALALEAVKVNDPPPEATRALSTVTFGMGTRAILRSQGLGHSVTALAFNMDSTLALSGGCSTLIEETCTAGELILWDIETATERRRLDGHTDWITSVAFDPTRRDYALSASMDGTLMLWNVDTGEVVRRLEGHAGKVNSVKFNPNGQTAISGSDDHTVILWDVTTGQIIRRFEGHAAGVTDVAFSPDGLLIAGSGDTDDPVVVLWQIATGEVIQRLTGPNARIHSTDFRSSSEGQLLVLAYSYDNAYREWNVESGTLIRSISVSNAHSRVTLLPDGNRLLQFEGNAFDLVDIGTWKVLVGTHTPTLGSNGTSNTISPNGKLALMGTEVGEIILVNLPINNEVHRFHSEGGLAIVDISPDGRYLLTGNLSTGTAILWDAQTGEEVRRLEGQEQIIAASKFSPDGQQVLVSSNDAFGGSTRGRVVLWDVETGDIIHQWTEFEFYPRSAAFSPTDHTALVGTLQWGAAWDKEGDGELVLLDLDTGDIIRRFEVETSILDISFSPDGRRAVTAHSLYGRITVWDVASGTAIRTFDRTSVAVAFIDNSRFLSGYEGVGAALLDAETGAVLQLYPASISTFWALAISPQDQKYVLGGGDRGQIYLWDFETGDEILRLSYPTAAAIWNVAFSPDGQTAYTSALDTQADVIEWRIADWSLDDLLTWTHENRYIRDFTCAEREQYRIEPLCD